MNSLGSVSYNVFMLDLVSWKAQSTDSGSRDATRSHVIDSDRLKHEKKYFVNFVLLQETFKTL